MMKKKTKEKIVTLIVVIAVIAIITCLTAYASALDNFSADIHLSIYNKSVENIIAVLMEENAEIKIQLYQDIALEDDILVNEFSFAESNPDCNIENGDENYSIYMLNRDYIIVSFKSRGMHADRTKYHIKDILVYLDYEENSANIVYESQKNERIIWGNSEQVVIYNFEEQFYQLIDLNTFSVIKQRNTKVIKMLLEFEIYPNENYFCLRFSPFVSLRINDRIIEKVSFDLEKIE